MLRKVFLGLANSSTARRALVGAPLTRALSQRFVPGEGISHLVEAVRSAEAGGLRATANYLGEAVRSAEDARAAARVYLRLLEALHEAGLEPNASLKFTQMGQEISESFLSENLNPVLQRARDCGAFLRFDMESSPFVTRTLHAFEGLWNEGWRDIGVVLQAYLKRTAGDVRRMIELGARVRLCKGAYAESADVAYLEMPRIRRNYLELAEQLLTEGVYPALATHDDTIIEGIQEIVARRGVARDAFEFQFLFGVRRDLHARLASEGYRVRLYVPFGDQWYPYLMRRLAERPENVAFLVGSVVKESPFRALWPR
jgi:proline dehydrogenase